MLFVVNDPFLTLLSVGISDPVHHDVLLDLSLLDAALLARVYRNWVNDVLLTGLDVLSFY